MPYYAADALHDGGYVNCGGSFDCPANDSKAAVADGHERQVDFILFALGA